ncbi:MAG: ATP phosphoribosyltransferase regulatory subunit [Firmicutes bacterium]|nr:ATP phosphoribosyltransferase regulatory subunit [Bacillota bacterium]
MNQIQLPLGMRDLILEECERKRMLQHKLENVFESYGYKEIMTPCIEFHNLYQTAFGTLEDEEIFKFFDQEGKILSLRTDMTVPIARVCATKFNTKEGPFRFRYSSNVYKVRQSFGGKRSEVMDCGIECIGLDSSCDIEVLNLAILVMEEIGAKYTLEIGNTNFFKSACKALQMDKESTARLADLIDRKSMVELKQFVQKLKLSPNAKEFFIQLPWMTGGQEALDMARELSFSTSLLEEVNKLQKLYNDLQALGYKDVITFDLGKVPHLDYYTGIIFGGYVEGVGVSVLSGGRYDKLLSKFGRDLPAIGFSVKIDYCIDVVKCEEKKTVKIYYPKNRMVEALQKANELRKECTVELIEAMCAEVEVA